MNNQIIEPIEDAISGEGNYQLVTQLIDNILNQSEIKIGTRGFWISVRDGIEANVLIRVEKFEFIQNLIKGENFEFYSNPILILSVINNIILNGKLE